MENTHTYKQINNIYKKLSYFDKYGTDVIMTIIICLVFFIFIAYYHVLNNVEPIKNDWINQRCRPEVMPFVGMINPPNDGRSKFQFTSDNFTDCSQSIIKQIMGYITKPIEYGLNLMTKFFMMMIEALNSIRKMLSKIRVQMQTIVKTIFARTLNISIGIQEFFIYLREIFNKIQGIFISGFYVVLGSYYTLKSSVGALFEFIVIILFVLIGMIIPLWIVPFTWGFAGFMTAIFLSISIPLSVIAIMMNQTMGTTLSGIPNKPSCFDENTLLQLNNGQFKKIKDIEVGDILTNNNIVTSKMKMSSKYETLYSIDGTFVTGDHKVYVNNKTICVKFHPYAKIVLNKEHKLYSLNTSNKFIQINNTIFCDYDEMTDDEANRLYENIEHHKNIIKNNDNIFIHKYYDGGFTANTEIKLVNHSFKRIDKIEINDILENGSRVIGIVEILNHSLHNKMNRMVVHNNEFYAHAHLNVKYLGKWTKIKSITSEKPINKKGKYTKLYHLITSNGLIPIGDMLFKDYDDILDGNL
jgi:hypothetical protein